MIRSTSLVLAVLICFGLFANMGTTQDVKKPDDKKGTKGYIPSGWKKLNLSAEQKKMIYAVQADYRPKIKSLEDQITHLKSQEHVEMVKVLTTAQKAELAKGLVPEETKKDEKKSEDKK